MASKKIPKRGTGSRGPVAPGQVYWIEDEGETYLVVVVRVGTGDNDLMTVYAYEWPEDPPDDLTSIDPSQRTLVYTLWKASRSKGQWTRIGVIENFRREAWPLEPMRHPSSGDLVIPHPDDPGAIIDQRSATPEETEGLVPYAFGNHVPLLITLRRMADPEIEFEPGTARPIRN